MYRWGELLLQSHVTTAKQHRDKEGKEILIIYSLAKENVYPVAEIQSTYP